MKSERAAAASAAKTLSPAMPSMPPPEPSALPAVAAANPFEHRLAALRPRKLVKTTKSAFHNPPQDKVVAHGVNLCYKLGRSVVH
ncbi:hypothetical protein AAES_02764 [Amazona aestiva]|uniref:Uncharacterized protein n=1 Tax=Amazona aestiva TaxID=12930 RepID=A0A0Q3U4A3_AMAAE|nr:hypothetical protein AAES_02764 [Amazona aestiva]